MASSHFTALIVDDEPWSREKIKQHLATVGWLRVVGEAEDAEVALQIAARSRPDMLFLDIEMPGRSGLDVVEGLDHDPVIVFTTAHARYAVTAFDVRAVDYLLKPFGTQRLAEALERAREVLESRGAGGATERTDGSEPLSRLYVRRRGKIVPIAVDAVIRFEARDDYVMIHTDKSQCLASVRMRELEERLDPTCFLRIHRSHIVNLEHVLRFSPHASGRLRVEMRDGTTLFVSRARSRELRRDAV